MATREEDIAYALMGFVEASKLHGHGIEWNDSKMQKKGCAGIGKHRDTIEKHTGSYDLLLPLLEHEAASVRFNAALTLIDDHFERVLPILHALDETCADKVGSSAGMVLRMYGQLDSGTTPETRETHPLVPKPRSRQMPRP